MTSKLTPFHPILRPILSEVFPHKLKYPFFRPANLQRKLLLTRNQSRYPVPFVARTLATSSGRDRMGSGSGQSVRAGSSKSLIDDEADLSDWVSGLNSSSFKKSRVYSDSENDGGGPKRRRESEFDNDSDFPSRRGGGGRGRGGGGPLGRGRGRGRNDAFPERNTNANESSGSSFGGRGRGRDSGEFRRGGRGGRGGGMSEGRRDRNDGFLSRGNDARGERRESERGSEMGYRNGRGRGGNRGGFASNRGGKGMERRGPVVTDDDDMEEENGRGYTGRGRGGNGGGFATNRGGKGMERRGPVVTDDDDMEEENGRGYTGRSRGGSRGGLAMKRGGKGMQRRGLLSTDNEDTEEEEDKGFSSFKELIDSDEADDDSEEEEDEEDDEDETGDDSDKGVSSQLPKSSLQQSDSYLSESRFDQCHVSSLSLKGIKDAGYEKMTLVQEATLPVILKGKDVLAKAKTGTGKTVAFLLPAIEIIAKSPPIGRDQKTPPISVLIICPTRELASQAAAEANKLLKYHPSIGVQVVIGGVRLALEQKRMQANACQILVATPGRLRDHIENTSGFATRLMGVKVLVLDEADHLLDMGFRKEIEKIIAAVPKQRQTLLFSATVPPQVRQICHVALKRDHEYINTVQEGSEDTHSQVRQMHLVVPLDKHFPLLYSLLKEHIADDVNYKVIVFCTTAMVTKLVAELLGELNLNVREIHSRKPQSYRTRVSDEFRKSTGLILVTSDVSARGVDYPDVTLVVQMGVPADKQQYIHRLGRTGRKGKEGQGILMLAPWEEYFLANVKDLPISKAPEPLVDPDTKKKVERALSHLEMKSKESAYQAWLGYYNSNKKVGGDKYRLVELANEFSRTMGLDNPPAIAKLVLGKMGLKNIPGLRSK